MSFQLNTLPSNDGFRMPAEFETQDGVWMAWPERSDNWRYGAKPAQRAFVEVASAIAQTTPVTMVVSNGQYANARRQLPPQIRVVEMTTDDAWLRDTGPSYVVNDKGERRGVDWQFNAWGGLTNGLYFPWHNDNALAQKVCEIYGDSLYKAPFVMEGGAIHVDGQGTLFTTEECLLSPGRNPGLGKEQLEQLLKDYLGVEKVVWLPRGVFQDETTGHVDNLMQVVAPGVVAMTWCDDPEDEQYESSQEAYRILSETVDARGRQLVVHKLPMPGPLYLTDEEASGIDASHGMNRLGGARLAGSYANFLITNKQVVFPLLDPAKDAQVAALLGEIFPGYLITGVNAREILLGGGNIHCITQQIPRV
ncbi:agmatine deiminase [Gallaecimonas kandeliae]|uniref:agmatine deiminase n=1 Tax=Gallaecimonas kandeliae TaxID=3029055 RepID=UPI00264809BC|nr:agmatine deiminase [Gallaecimonas kandeliae]WKE64655.1 agmatine deiminase [Gallaecimonas kandeliae]